MEYTAGERAADKCKEIFKEVQLDFMTYAEYIGIVMQSVAAEGDNAKRFVLPEYEKDNIEARRRNNDFITELHKMGFNAVRVGNQRIEVSFDIDEDLDMITIPGEHYKELLRNREELADVLEELEQE